MKKFKNVLDGFRSSSNAGGVPGGPPGAGPPGGDRSYQINEVVENLRPDNFSVAKTFCHGFPYQPTAIAFDPIQKLIAIGTQSGSLRILGRPGVDIHQESLLSNLAVIHLEFLVNEGKIVSVTADDVLHLWDFSSHVKPEIIHSLKFQRERITAIKIPIESRYMYVGTERGNIHVVNVDSFTLSGYIINWNKAVELSRKTHPGPVVYLGDNPTDPSKLLVGYESGSMVLWDLKIRVAEMRFQANESLRSVAWNSDGRMFVSSHSDGSLLTWNTKLNKPVTASFPHARGKDVNAVPGAAGGAPGPSGGVIPGNGGKPEVFKPIMKVDWKSSRTGDNFVIFSGGLGINGENSHGAGSHGTSSLTVIHGKTTTVLEMEHNVLDFIVMCDKEWESGVFNISEIQDPTGIIVLLQSDLVIIDLLTPGYPCYPNPYPMDLHESPVTTCVYFANCPGDLIPALYSVGAKANKKTSGYSDREWPVNGGSWGTSSCSYTEIVITGHADGSVKFWDASSTSLQVLYKLKTSKAFERTSSKKSEDSSDPYAVQLIKLCPESRLLLVAGASSQVLLFKFRRQENSSEIAMLEIPIVNDLVEDEFGGFDYTQRVDRSTLEFFSLLRVKSGVVKKSPGYQVELVCLTPWVNGEPPGGVCSLAISSGNGLLGYGTETGVVIVDYIQQVCLLSNATPDLYGTADPYTRAPKSPSSLKNKDESPPDSQQSLDNCASTPDGGEFPLSSQQVPGGAAAQGAAASSAMSSLEDAHQQQQSLSLPPQPSQAAKSPKSSWANVKSIFAKGLHKKGNLGAGGAGGPISSDVPTSDTSSRTESRASIVAANSDTSELPTAEMRSTSSRDSLERPESTSTMDEQERLMVIAQSNDEDSDDSSNDTFKMVSRPRDLPLAAEKGTSSAPTAATPPVAPPRQRKAKKSKEPPMSPTQLVFSASTSLSNSSAGGAGGGGVSGGGSGGGRGVGGGDQARSPGGRKAGAEQPRRSKSQDKLDSTFSRSRSSSMSSLDNITSESIQCLTFVETFPKKNDSGFTVPTVWVGTSLGSILVLNIGTLGSNRQTDPLTITPSGTIFRLKGAILEMTFMDATGAWLSGSTESWRDEAARARTPTKSSSRGSPTDPGLANALHYAILVSEKQSRVVSLPSQTCLYKAQLVNNAGGGGAAAAAAAAAAGGGPEGASAAGSSSSSVTQPSSSSSAAGGAGAGAPVSSSAPYFVIKAGVTTIKDSPCLVTYNSNGHLSIYSLPSLRILVDVDFVPLSDLSFLLSQASSGGVLGAGSGRKSGLLVDPMLSIWGQQIIIGEDTNLIAKTFCISEFGHGLYLSSPSEVQKFTISSDFAQNVETMLGSLYIATELPERPKESFFTGLFSGAPKNLDREELFGEASGKAPRHVAKLLTGPAPSPQMERMGARLDSVGGEVARTRLMLIERGEKLGHIEDKTQKMMDNAENFSSAAHQLMLKYKDKKWYQL